MFKKIISILISSVIVLGLVACGNSTNNTAASNGDGEEQLRITFVSPLVGHPYWVQVSEGVNAAGEDFSVDVKEVGPTTISVDEQIQAIETAIASKVDGILTMALNPEAFKPVIDRAKAEGIPVVLIDTDAPESDRDVYAGTSNKAAGIEAGKSMIEATGGNAKIGIITGAIDAENLNLRIEGFKEAIKDEAGMEIIAIEASNSDLLQGTEKAQSMLKAHPEINAFFGASATDGIGAGKTVSEKGLVGKVTIVGFDDMDETLDYIRDGVIYSTIVQKPYQMGYIGIETLKDLNEGKSSIEEIIDTGVTIVKKDNVDSYK